MTKTVAQLSIKELANGRFSSKKFEGILINMPIIEKNIAGTQT